jgi:hypothetical protein
VFQFSGKPATVEKGTLIACYSMIETEGYYIFTLQEMDTAGDTPTFPGVEQAGPQVVATLEVAVDETKGLNLPHTTLSNQEVSLLQQFLVMSSV